MKSLQSAYPSKNPKEGKVYIIVIADGASDHLRSNGKSPLELAHTPYLDQITAQSATGTMKTLYEDLPKGSVVAQMGILGYDPHQYLSGGRAAFELPVQAKASPRDLLFRANIVHFQDEILQNYNADGISTGAAKPLIAGINQMMADKFPDFELWHVSDFRNILIIREADVNPVEIICPEPHEHQGAHFNLSQLIRSDLQGNNSLTNRLNQYLVQVHSYVTDHLALPYAIFPWSPSTYKKLPSFSEQNNFSGKAGIIGNADFLRGFGKAMDIPFFQMGNGLWNTDYNAKGQCVINCIKEGYSFIYCHINGPDEASHMNNLGQKITSIERIDRDILGPIFKYFQKQPSFLGSLLFCPDHYTNIHIEGSVGSRKEAHSIDPVPFLIWDRQTHDEVMTFSETSVLNGLYADKALTHLDMMQLMRSGASSLVGLYSM
jgi:2,3-bisphosphoglycerate-independent phosphoglycerate mutase